MKKLILTICAAFMLSGCGAKGIHYATSVPPEKLCTLYIANTLSVTQFNGESVDWSVSPFSAWAMVQIPEGTHTFVADYERTMNYARESAKDVKGGGIFIAGRTYHMFDSSPDSSASFNPTRGAHIERVVIRIREGRPPNS